MLGATLVDSLKNKYEVYATGNSNFKEEYAQYMKFDLASASFEELINWSNPDVIIHSGALTNGNYCKENPDKALDINGLSLSKLIQATKPHVKIIYISTDAVFPSELSMATEKDCRIPENVYGKSKEIGEFFLSNSERDYVIIRTTIVGYNLNSSKSGFVEWIINSSINMEEIGLFEDVVFTPISIYDLATEIQFLIDNKDIRRETLHITGAESCTKFEFGLELLKSLNLNTQLVKKSSILAFTDRAKRCTDQTLSTKLYQNKYKRELPTFSETINSLKEKYYELN